MKMKTHVMPEIQPVLNAVHYRPAVSIILPFEPKMGLKNEITHSLKIAADQVEDELQKNYPEEIKEMVMEKLRSIIKSLNFNTHKKSIAIYVSPLFEKVLYLDIAVQERVMVDDSFEIRDLVYSKKQIHKYLVLLLSSKESSIYIGNSTTFVRILVNSSESSKSLENDLPERVANFSDMEERKEIQMHKFLHQVDKTLEIILQAHQLPLFVVATERIAGHFKKLTKHADAVIEYVHGNYEDATLPQLKVLLEPHVADWKQVIQKDILNQLQNAAGKKKLAIGMRNVWREATNRKGSLLVVEKNYMYAAEHGSKEDEIHRAGKTLNSFSSHKDAVDDAIEKVLENGGDVEFTDEGLLEEYDHIALIQYY
jgi:hypothetical protein